MNNEKLAECRFETRLLFIYLWMLADRAGRLEDRPRRIAAQAFPYDRDLDLDAMLDELAGDFILRYEVNGQRYIQIVNFERHQNPHLREKPSELPGPDEPGASTVPAPGQPERTGKAEASKASRRRKSANGAAPPDPADEILTEIKPIYPKRSGDQPWTRARKAIRARLAEGHTAEELVAGVGRYAAWCRATGKVGTETVKMAATFFGPDKPFLEPWTPPQGGNGSDGRLGMAPPAPGESLAPTPDDLEEQERIMGQW